MGIGEYDLIPMPRDPAPGRMGNTFIQPVTAQEAASQRQNMVTFLHNWIE